MFVHNVREGHAVQFPHIIITHYELVSGVYVHIVAWCKGTVMDMEPDALAKMAKNLSALRPSTKVNSLSLS